MRREGYVARVGERRNVYSVLVGRPESKTPLGRPRCRWEYNIKMNLHEAGCGSMDWIDLTQVAGTCACGDEPSGSVKCGEFLD
jgi:hypothetical protein